MSRPCWPSPKRSRPPGNNATKRAVIHLRRRWLEWAVAGLAFASLAGFAANYVWMTAPLDHIRLHFAAGAFGVGLLAWWTSRHRWALISAVVVALNVSLAPAVWTWPRPAETVVAVHGDEVIRIAAINLLTSNQRYDDALALVRRERPDVILWIETDERWINAVSALRDEYEQLVAYPRDDNFGYTVQVRRDRWRGHAEIFWPDTHDFPAVRARIEDRQGRAFRLYGMHPPPPDRPGWPPINHRILRTIANAARASDLPVVVAGDFNAAPWSMAFRRFREESGLIECSRAHGYLATWPTRLPAWLRIPLDHVFASPGFTILRRRAGEPIGSDHLPIIADLSWPPTPSM